MIAILALAAAQALPSSPEVGRAAGRCRPGESGPAIIVTVVGLKDRKGLLKVELYPANDADFLADDNVLIAAGKTFRRVEIPVPAVSPVEVCIRAPAPGVYALSVLHDRDGNRKFSLSVDGIGFAGNPKLGWSKPAAAVASIRVGAGPTPARVVLNYRRGSVSFGPIGRK